MDGLEYTVLLLFELYKKFTCPSGKLRTTLTSAIATSSSPRLSDSTFFAHWGWRFEDLGKNALQHLKQREKVHAWPALRKKNHVHIIDSPSLPVVSQI